MVIQSKTYRDIKFVTEIGVHANILFKNTKPVNSFPIIVTQRTFNETFI